MDSIKESQTNGTVGDLVAALDCTTVSLAPAASAESSVERDSALGTTVESSGSWSKFKSPDVPFSSSSASSTASLKRRIPDESSHVVESLDFRLRVVLAATGIADDDETLAVLRRYPLPDVGKLAVTFLLTTDTVASDGVDRRLDRAVFCTVDSRQRDLFRPAAAAATGRE
jgi:hypothetical protein